MIVSGQFSTRKSWRSGQLMLRSSLFVSLFIFAWVLLVSKVTGVCVECDRQWVDDFLHQWRAWGAWQTKPHSLHHTHTHSHEDQMQMNHLPE